MKRVLIALSMLTATGAYADWTMPKCDLYVHAATYGANQQLRGAERKIVYVDHHALVELIEHGVGSQAIYFLKDPNVQRDEQVFTEDAAYRGYDLMKAWRAKNGDELPKEDVWEASLQVECKTKEGV